MAKLKSKIKSKPAEPKPELLTAQIKAWATPSEKNSVTLVAHALHVKSAVVVREGIRMVLNKYSSLLPKRGRG